MLWSRTERFHISIILLVFFWVIGLGIGEYQVLFPVYLGDVIPRLMQRTEYSTYVGLGWTDESLPIYRSRIYLSPERMGLVNSIS